MLPNLNGSVSVKVVLIFRETGSEYSCKWCYTSGIYIYRDFYVIRGFSPSVEGLTAYRSLAVPDCILPEHTFDIKQNICYSLITTMNVAVPLLVSFLLCAHEFPAAMKNPGNIRSFQGL